MSARHYVVHVWDVDTAGARWSRRTTARDLARAVDDAERELRQMRAMRSLEEHVIFVVVVSGDA